MPTFILVLHMQPSAKDNSSCVVVKHRMCTRKPLPLYLRKHRMASCSEVDVRRCQMGSPASDCEKTTFNRSALPVMPCMFYFTNHSCLSEITLRRQHEGPRRKSMLAGHACNLALVGRQAGQG